MMKKVLICLAALAFLCLFVAYTHWRWGECRKVGHGVMYCVLDAGR